LKTKISIFYYALGLLVFLLIKIKTHSNFIVSKKEKALAMQSQWQEQNFFPQRGNELRLDLVRGSFTTGIMNPTTSFIALENDAQKAMLKKKQEQVLNAHKFLDVGNEPQRMSEPKWYFLFVLFSLFLAFRNQK
jgi:hypothetical protein